MIPQPKGKNVFQLILHALSDKTLIILAVAAAVAIGIGIYEAVALADEKEGPGSWVEGVAIVFTGFRFSFLDYF